MNIIKFFQPSAGNAKFMFSLLETNRYARNDLFPRRKIEALNPARSSKMHAKEMFRAWKFSIQGRERKIGDSPLETDCYAGNDFFARRKIEARNPARSRKMHAKEKCYARGNFQSQARV